MCACARAPEGGGGFLCALYCALKVMKWWGLGREVLRVTVVRDAPCLLFCYQVLAWYLLRRHQVFGQQANGALCPDTMCL